MIITENLPGRLFGIGLVRDELLEMFTRSTGEDWKDWIDDPGSWKGPLEGGYMYLMMAYRLDTALTDIYGSIK